MKVEIKHCILTSEYSHFQAFLSLPFLEEEASFPEMLFRVTLLCYRMSSQRIQQEVLEMLGSLA